MDLLNIVFGVVGLISFIFSIYTYFKTDSKRSIEAAKNAMYQERVRNVQYSLSNILRNVDALVQLPKKDDGMTINQLQNIARLARAQLFVLSQQLETEQENLGKWRFGEFIMSDPQPDDLQEVNED